MAYISQEEKKELAPAIKAVAKKYGRKVTIGIRNHMDLVVKVKVLKTSMKDFVRN